MKSKKQHQENLFINYGIYSSDNMVTLVEGSLFASVL